MAKKSAVQNETPAAGHNVQTEREQFEEQTFLNGYRQIKDIKSEIAASMGDAKDIYARLKNIGFTKADVKWAMELEEKDAGDVIATMQRRIRIAKMFGHGLARQIELFDTDRAPVEERAYEDGLAAGKLRKDNANPYGADSAAGQAWQRGFNDGTAFANKDLAAQFEEKSGDELIQGARDDDPFAESENLEAAE